MISPADYKKTYREPFELSIDALEVRRESTSGAAWQSTMGKNSAYHEGKARIESISDENDLVFCRFSVWMLCVSSRC